MAAAALTMSAAAGVRTAKSVSISPKNIKTEKIQGRKTLERKATTTIAKRMAKHMEGETEYTEWCQSQDAFEAAGGNTQYWPFAQASGEGVTSATLQTCTYEFTLWWEGTDQLDVFFRADKNDPTVGQFKMVDWGGDGVDLIIDAVWSEEYSLWLLAANELAIDEHATYGTVYVSDVASYIGLGIGESGEDEDGEYSWYDYYSCYDPEAGEFDLYMIYYVSAGYFDYNYEYAQMDTYYVPDYSVTFNSCALNKACTMIQANFTLGTDVDKAVAVITDNNIDYVAMAVSDVADEAISYVDVTTPVLGDLRQISFDKGEGEYRLVIITMDADGNLQNYASYPILYYPNGDPWKSIGQCEYTDDFMTGLYTDAEPTAFEVEITENQNVPGLFRLVNPYADAYPYNEEGDYDTESSYYVEINANDPTHVYLTTQQQALNWGYGQIIVSSMAFKYMVYGYTKEEIEAEGLYGTYAYNEGTERWEITFPDNVLMVCEPEYSTEYYAGNSNGAFKVVLPEDYTATAIRSIAADNQSSDNRIYTIDGRQVSRTTRGLYIRGGKKMIVK